MGGGIGDGVRKKTVSQRKCVWRRGDGTMSDVVVGMEHEMYMILLQSRGDVLTLIS